MTSDEEISFINPNDLDFEEEGDYWVDVNCCTPIQTDEDGNGPQGLGVMPSGR